jgi:hypothetical protein
LQGGYEKGQYERSQAKEREERAQRFAEPKASTGDTPTRPTHDTVAAAVAPPSEDGKAPIKLTLRGAAGAEVKVLATADMKAIKLLRWYCRKTGKDDGDAHGLALEFDGEEIDHTTTVGDMDVESGDMLDVR